MPVYFIQRGDWTGPIKIGMAKDAEYRLRKLQIGSPEPLKLLMAVESDDKTDAELEREFHERFDASHIRGEWFLPYSVLDFVEDTLRENGLEL